MAYAHPMFRLLLAHPELLAEHAGGYGELLCDELQAVGTAWQRRALLLVVAGGALLAGVVLLGQAAMWWAVLPNHLWYPMLAVPVVPLAVGAWAAWAATRPAPASADAWASLRRQLSADLALIREAASAR